MYKSKKPEALEEIIQWFGNLRYMSSEGDITTWDTRKTQERQ